MPHLFSKISIAILLLLFNTNTCRAQDPILEAIKEATKKVIRAIDLQIQRIQNNTIDLQNVQKNLENILSKLKLEEIADWTNKQKEIYQSYFDELWRIKSYLLYYRQFKDVVGKQKLLYAEYKKAIQIVGQDNHFAGSEQEYMYGVYAGILEASINDIGDLLTIMESFTLQMSDAARLEMLQRTATNIDEHLSVLRQFNQRNKMLSLYRSHNEEDVKAIQKLYGF
jgi:hypothetical protein